MAKVTQLRDSVYNVEIIYNVDHSVGKFGRNRKADVQLVQVLLNALIETTKRVGPVSRNPDLLHPDPAPEPLRPDGICGPKTKAAILWFQKSGTGALDETINSVDDVGRYGKPGHYRTYTLWSLNMMLAGRHALPAKSAITVEPLASELRKFALEPRIE
jgi:hypothetical protein